MPLNRSGETPLDVAKRAGFYEEIFLIYEHLGLPTTIDPSKKRKYIPEPIEGEEIAEVANSKIIRPVAPECQKNFCKFSAFSLELENFSLSLEHSQA